MAGFTEDHDIFRSTVKRFLQNELVPRAEQWEAEGILPREVFPQCAAQGFLGIRYPDAVGGSDLDYWYTIILTEELARAGLLGLGVDLLVQSEFATNVINSVGTPEQIKEILIPAIAGKKLVALGVTEPGAGSNVAAIRTSARREGDVYIVNGSKTFISNAMNADYVTLAVRTGEADHKGISLLVMPTNTEGFSRRKLHKTGIHTSQTAELFFDDCRVPTRYLLGRENEGFKLIMEHFQGERLVLASFANGMMLRAYDLAYRYGTERKVFDKPILGHQVWRHRMADVLTRIEAARQLTNYACDFLNRHEPDAERAISMAKLFACETVRPVVMECYQVFGGYAYMEEYPIARVYREIGAMTIGAGSSEVMREIIAKMSAL